MPFIIHVLLSLFFVPLIISSAHAEVWVWQDPQTKASLSVPDTWRRVHNQQPDDLVTFVAPGENDYASCRLRAREDRRFVIYPVRFSDEIQRQNYNVEFWQNYLAEYESAVIHNFQDNSSLGRGFASYAEASYLTTVGPQMQKRSLMFGGVYAGNIYVLECSAQAHAYPRWHEAFLSVAKFVDFRKSIFEFPGSNWRGFEQDRKLQINSVREAENSVY